MGADSFDLNIAWCLMRIAHAGFLSDTTHCPMVTSKSVGRMTVPESESGPLPVQRHFGRIFSLACEELILLETS